MEKKSERLLSGRSIYLCPLKKTSVFELLGCVGEVSLPKALGEITFEADTEIQRKHLQFIFKVPIPKALFLLRALTSLPAFLSHRHYHHNAPFTRKVNPVEGKRRKKKKRGLKEF